MKRLHLALAAVVGMVLGVAGDQALMRGRPRPAAPAVAAQLAPAAAPVPRPAPAVVPGQEDPRAIYRVPLEDSPARGVKSALVTIVEASDFECPFCKRVVPTLKRVEAEFGEKVRFVFKENPLSIHANALPAAMLAEEARAQGGDGWFWAVHDKLFSLPALDRASLEKAALEVGLSADGVKAALDDGRHLARIRRDQTLMGSLGAGGTPTFFVNGRKLVGAQPFEAFKALIDEELARAEAAVRSGVAPSDLYAQLTEKGATAPAIVPGGSQQPAQVAKVPLRSDDPIRGARVAPVTVVLFSDFQCPFCARIEPTLKQLQAAYGDKVRFSWKHQPLPFHPNALPAAKAAEAARLAGKFWEMHDKLFANQQSLSDTTYAQYARELRLEPARFQRDASSTAIAQRIGEDQQLAAAVGAGGTPTLFVNCRRLVGAQPFEAFKAVIDEELATAETMKAKGDRLDATFYEKICASNLAGPLAVR